MGGSRGECLTVLFPQLATAVTLDFCREELEVKGGREPGRWEGRSQEIGGTFPRMDGWLETKHTFSLNIQDGHFVITRSAVITPYFGWTTCHHSLFRMDILSSLTAVISPYSGWTTSPYWRLKTVSPLCRLDQHPTQIK